MASTPPPNDGADAGPPGPEDALDAPDAPDAPRVLVASLGAGWVAVPAELVEAVVRPAPVTRVGGTPAWLVGVAAVRGAIRAVVDARRGADPASAAARDDGAASAWWVVVARGGRSAALAGLRVWRVVPVADAGAGGGDGDGPAPADARVGAAPAVPGLPVGGVARLAGDPGRGADALPRAVWRLDVAALLDRVHDPTTPQP